MESRNGKHFAGFIGKVAAIVDNFGECLDFTNGHRGYANKYEPWQPRVGERVRVVNPVVVSHWNEFWAKENGAKLSLGGFVYVTKFIPDYLRGKAAVEIAAKQTGSGPRWLIDKFEPILATATTATPEQRAALKIEAGKFYKTRDGRKVGPMEFVDFGDGEPWHTSDTDRWWSDDGTRRDGSIGEIDDLIAEWIDEPVAKPEASNDNAQPKFKVGDRVRVVKEGFTKSGSGHNAKIGDEFVLREMNPSKAFWRTNGPDFYEHEIELVVFASIVALIENGQPKPSSTPHVHASTSAAEKEAKRLAAKFKGKKFGVFTLTTTHEEAAPVYDHKWQNMAALGLKIDAIRELRAVAGLTLRGAKDAVEAWINYQDAA